MESDEDIWKERKSGASRYRKASIEKSKRGSQWMDIHLTLEIGPYEAALSMSLA